MDEKIMIKNAPKKPDEKLPIVNVAPGYGRFNTWIGKDDTNYLLVFYYSPDKIQPGIGVIPDDEDRSKWEQVIGINITDPKSADAWSSVFKNIANRMRKDAIRKNFEELKEATSNIQEEKSNEDGSKTTE